MTAREMMGERPGLLGGLWENRTLILAVVGLVIVGWLHFRESSALPTPIQGYTEAQVNDAKTKAVEEATKPLKGRIQELTTENETLRQSNAKQVSDAVAKVTAQYQAQIAQSDTPVSVDKLPTSLKLLFKGNDIQELASQNVIWTKVMTWHEEKVTTLLGDRSNPFPVWTIILIFKKPIIFKKIESDDTGAQMASSGPRYAAIEFSTQILMYSYQNTAVEITVK
jgi:hypothetical protein